MKENCARACVGMCVRVCDDSKCITTPIGALGPFRTHLFPAGEQYASHGELYTPAKHVHESESQQQQL